MVAQETAPIIARMNLFFLEAFGRNQLTAVQNRVRWFKGYKKYQPFVITCIQIFR